MPPIRADVAYNTLAGISFSLFKEYKEYHKKQKHNREYGIWNADRGTAPSARYRHTFRNPRSAFRIPYLRSEDRWARDSRVHSGVHEDRFSTTWFLACRWRRKLFKTFGTRSGRCRPSAEPFLN